MSLEWIVYPSFVPALGGWNVVLTDREKLPKPYALAVVTPGMLEQIGSHFDLVAWICQEIRKSWKSNPIDFQRLDDWETAHLSDRELGKTLVELFRMKPFYVEEPSAKG